MISKILKTKSKQFQNKINNAPTTPGCYLYKDKDGNVLYVGKAKNIRKRVQSYFANYKKLDIKIQNMIDLSNDIQFIEVDTEVEALILELNLIKKFKTKYNVLMRDDKNYIFVKFEKVRRSNQQIPTKNSIYQDFPTIKIVREKLEDGADYFGPYPDSMPAKRILRKLRKVFPYCTANHLFYQISENPLEIYTTTDTPCFYYHIGLCKGACAGLEKKSDYVDRFNSIKRFFNGEKSSLINELEKQLKESVKNLEFENAAKIRDKINDIKYVTSHIGLDNSVDDVLIEKHKSESRKNAINDLIERLKFPPEKLKNHKGFRIECYDISNIMGTNATGSMVVMIDGLQKNSFYRRFRIRSQNEPNDFLMLKEVLARRFRSLILNNHFRDKDLNNLSKEDQQSVEQFEEKWGKDLFKKLKDWKNDESFSQKPDLIIIDGGKGQLSSVFEIMKIFGLHNDIPVVGLAKREEEIFKIREQFQTDVKFYENTFERIKLPLRSESLFLVQRIRDEAHRFAKSYHKKLRNKNFVIKDVTY